MVSPPPPPPRTSSSPAAPWPEEREAAAAPTRRALPWADAPDARTAQPEVRAAADPRDGKARDALRDARRRMRAMAHKLRNQVADARAALAAATQRDRAVDDAVLSRRSAFDDAHAQLVAWQNDALVALVSAVEASVQPRRETLGDALRSVPKTASPTAHSPLASSHAKSALSKPATKSPVRHVPWK